MTTSSTQLNVLIVDDDDLDRERVRRALCLIEPEPNLVEAESVTDATQALKDEHFDCVVLDYRLPEGACIEFLPDLQAQAPRTAFVVVTGQGDASIAVDLMKAGASDYLSKDNVDAPRLRQAVKYAVALRRAEAHAEASEAARRHHAERVGRFVDGAHEIVAARSIDQLATAASVLALDVFDAHHVCVLLRDAEHETIRRCGTSPDDLELVAWATRRLIAQPGLVQEPPCIAVELRGRDGAYHGLIAMHCKGACLTHLLRQLAVMVSVCCDGLSLYDAASRAIRARDDVMAVVSHDLRAPLNNVRLGSSLLRETTTPAAQPVLDRVERNVTHMARLVDDLVDMVRLESGRLPVSIGRESPNELMATAAGLIADMANHQRIRLVLRECEPHLLVSADRDRVLQVLSNLLSNAMKFTPINGTVELDASEHAGRVRFGVHDTGRGVPPEEAKRIFVRFWQSDPKRRHGLGLGLYIAKGLVQAHGGDLWFESEVGVGSHFYFTLPKAAAREARSSDGASPARVAARSS